jgi:hypothetical protein
MQRLKHPVRSITEPFGKAGLTVAICALVLAMVGGAWAAAGLNSKQKKEVTKIAKKYAGKPGAAGAAGPTGPAAPAGPKGDTGAKGETGSAGGTGPAGKSVLTEAAGGECPEGGTKFKVEGAVTSSHVCNGEEGEPGPTGPNGSPWTAGGTLPPNQTEEGSWSLIVGHKTKISAVVELSLPRTAVSFGIPLASSPTAVYLKVGETEPTNCPGTVEEPQAALGFLCVYAEFETGGVPALSANPKTYGALINGVGGEEGGIAGGSWAVTAPPGP